MCLYKESGFNEIFNSKPKTPLKHNKVNHISSPKPTPKQRDREREGGREREREREGERERESERENESDQEVVDETSQGEQCQGKFLPPGLCSRESSAVVLARVVHLCFGPLRDGCSGLLRYLAHDVCSFSSSSCCSCTSCFAWRR